MITFLLIIMYITMITIKCYQFMYFRPPNFPPGPPRLPIFGAYLFLLALNYKKINKAIDRLCAYYKTNIIGFYYGPIPVIVVNDVDTVKEALRNRDLDGKPNILLAQLRSIDFVTKGLIFTDGQLWQDNRRFSLRHLRDYGYGRRFNDFELNLETELFGFIDMIRNGPKYQHETEFIRQYNSSILCPTVFFSFTGNAFLKLLCNQTIPRENHDILLKAAEYSKKFVKNADSYGRMFSLLPLLTKLFPNLSGYNQVRDSSVDLYKFLVELVEKEKKTFNKNSTERHFLDLYLNEIEKSNDNNGVNTTQCSFTMEQLIMNLMDFIMPTFTTLSTTMTFFIHRMILHPNIVRKIHFEIDDCVGMGRLPNLDDRQNMPYLEATIRETLRLETVIPSGFPHFALNSTKLVGYDVPKGTVIVTGLQSANTDKSKFDQPMDFKPERFLDENGHLCLSKDLSMPFGAGKRLCAAETFSRNLLFLMTSALMQNFNPKKLTNEAFPTCNSVQNGLVTFLPDFWVKFESR